MYSEHTSFTLQTVIILNITSSLQVIVSHFHIGAGLFSILSFSYHLIVTSQLELVHLKLKKQA